MLSRADRTRATGHVEALASKHKIELFEANSWEQAYTYVKSRRVWVPDILTGSDYIVCLHEMGHVVDKDSRRYGNGVKRVPHGRPSNHHEIMHEAAAWSWAVQHAKLHLLRLMTRADWERVGDCWATYLSC